MKDLLNKSDEEIFAIAKPFWENLVKSSNLKDYGGFTRDFSTQMLFGANEVCMSKLYSDTDCYGKNENGSETTIMSRYHVFPATSNGMFRP